MRKLPFALGILLLLSMIPTTHAGSSSLTKTINQFTVDQRHLMVKAYELGSLLDLPETLQAVLLQETFAGHHGRVNWGDEKVAYGVTQVKPSTAREIIEKRLPDLVEIVEQDETFIATLDLDGVESLSDHQRALYTNDMHALAVSAVLLKENIERTGSWRRGVLAYYEGVSGSGKLSDKEIEEHFYFQGIAENLQLAREFNKLHGLD